MRNLSKIESESFICSLFGSEGQNHQLVPFFSIQKNQLMEGEHLNLKTNELIPVCERKNQQKNKPTEV